MPASPPPTASPLASPARSHASPRSVWPTRLLSWLPPLAIVVVSAWLMLVVQSWIRTTAAGDLESGYLMQIWSSNWTMQTMGLEDMLAFGPQALWLDHVYPPLLDAFRFVLVQPDKALLGLDAGALGAVQREVDMQLYTLYVVLYGIVNAIVYLWVRDLTRSSWWALGATVLWAVAPGYVMVMTLLETTPLAMTLIAASFYLLYRFLRTRRLGYASGFLAMVLLGSLTRNITQWHVILVLAVFVVAAWFIAKRRAWWVQALNVVLFGLLLVMPAKQFVMYDTFDTSTYAGYHRVGPLWIDPTTVAVPEFPQDIVDNALRFSSRFNTQETLKDNYRLGAAANEKMFTDPVGTLQSLAKSLTITVPEGLKPATAYTQNQIVDRMPWRGVYDWLFSGWRYGVLGLWIAAVMIRAYGWRGLLGLGRRYGWLLGWYALIAIPVIWSNRYYVGREGEGPVWTEITRLKLFIELPLYVLLAYTIWLAVRGIRGRRASVSAHGRAKEFEGDPGGVPVAEGLSA